MLLIGETGGGGGRRVYGHSALSAQLFCNSKAVLKIESINKI